MLQLGIVVEHEGENRPLMLKIEPISFYQTGIVCIFYFRPEIVEIIHPKIIHPVKKMYLYHRFR